MNKKTDRIQAMIEMGGLPGINEMDFNVPPKYDVKAVHKGTHFEFEKAKKPIKSDGWSTSYYDIPEGAKDIGDIMNHRNMNFNVGNIFKAAYRLGRKDGVDEAYDLNKIIWFAKHELKRLGLEPKE